MTLPISRLRVVSMLLPALVALCAPPALAAADQPAPNDIRQTIENACMAAAAPRMNVADIRVDPFGTHSYGVAVITDGDTGAEYVCVYEKASGRTEIGSALAPKPDPSQPFSPQDLKQLTAISDQVRATLNDMAARGFSIDGNAATVEALLEGKVKSDAVATAPVGDYRCTLYWYGFLDKGEDRVGTHQCTVSREQGGGLVIDKTTGDRLHAETAPWNGRTAYAGRSFLPDHAETRYDPAHPDNAQNDNYGNVVGLVFRSGERLFLVSTGERGMTEPDPTFFSVLELVPQL